VASRFGLRVKQHNQRSEQGTLKWSEKAVRQDTREKRLLSLVQDGSFGSSDGVAASSAFSAVRRLFLRSA